MREGWLDGWWEGGREARSEGRRIGLRVGATRGYMDGAIHSDLMNCKGCQWIERGDLTCGGDTSSQRRYNGHWTEKHGAQSKATRRSETVGYQVLGVGAVNSNKRKEPTKTMQADAMKRHNRIIMV